MIPITPVPHDPDHSRCKLDRGPLSSQEALMTKETGMPLAAELLSPPSEVVDRSTTSLSNSM